MMRWSVVLFALGLLQMPAMSLARPVSDKEAQSIAKEAYIYGVPMVTVYSTLYAFSIDDEWKSPAVQAAK